jgi:hypothetical protein
MRYSEEQLVSACMTYQHDFGIATPTIRESVRRQMAQILENLPEPGIAADLAACRMERNHWLQRATELEQARACPDRETLAKALRDAYERGMGRDPSDGEGDAWEVVEDGYLAEAEKAIELCASRVPSEVLGLVAKWHAHALKHGSSAMSYDAGFDTGLHSCARELEAALKAVPTADTEVLVYWKEKAGRLKAEVASVTAVLNDRSTQLAQVKYERDKMARERAAPKPVVPAPSFHVTFAEMDEAQNTPNEDGSWPETWVALNRVLAKRPAEPAPRLNAYVDESSATWLYQEYERQLEVNPLSMQAMLAALRKMESSEDDVREALSSAQEEILTLEARVRELSTRLAEPAPRFQLTLDEYQAAHAMNNHVTRGVSLFDRINMQLAKRPGPSPRALPTREELLGILHAAWYKYPLVEAARSHRLHLEAMAAAVEGLLREYASPASDEAEALREAVPQSVQQHAWTPELADKIWDALEASDDVTSGQLYEAGKHVIGTPEEGAVYWHESDKTVRPYRPGEEPAPVSCYAQMLAEADRSAAELMRERDEARAECERLRGLLEDADKTASCVAKLEAVVAENKRKADDHRRQRDLFKERSDHMSEEHDKAINERDEARSELQRVTALYDRSRSQAERALEAELNQLHVQLAARPDPVVIDEALAQIVLREMVGAEPSPASERPAILCAILKRRLGNNVSVAAPKPHPGPFTPHREAELRNKPAHYCVHEVFPVLDQLRAERATICELFSVPVQASDLVDDLRLWRAEYDRQGEALGKRAAELAKARETLARTDPCVDYTLQLRRIADAAGVEVPIDEIDVAVIDAVKQLRAELQSTQDRLKGTLALADERSNDKARVEHELLEARIDLQAAQAELDAKHAKLVSVADKLQAVREQHEALRTGISEIASAMEHAGDPSWPYAEQLRTILSPATPEQSEARAAIERLTAVTDAHRRALQGMCAVFGSVAGSTGGHPDAQQLAVDLDCAIREALDARKAVR